MVKKQFLKKIGNALKFCIHGGKKLPIWLAGYLTDSLNCTKNTYMQQPLTSQTN
jgi:hypothetical protein